MVSKNIGQHVYNCEGTMHIVTVIVMPLVQAVYCDILYILLADLPTVVAHILNLN